MLDILGYLFITLGVLVFIVSSIGLLRMPDVYTRMHISTKATTIGTISVLIGACFLEPTWSFKLLLIALFILLTNPLSSSVIARATHKDGLTLQIDELKEEK
ncbi:MAG: multicomponent Na+:H+ antiporter subunit G [Sulfurimonas sp.]|jgi:multicomponent Na+:H+ antiporter subunit G|uniref:monovalent cation/H(+) antiporter subunit G n=1 Tax=Sulfurimonas sp. TaxID=2022749 RepID=UPI0039E28D0E